MVGSVISELAGKKSLQVYIDETKAKYAGIFWPSLLKTVPSDNLKWSAVIGDRKAGVAGNVTAFNVSAPLHTRDALREKDGRIPSIRGKRVMDENDLHKYLELSKQNNLDINRVLALIYDDIEFCSIAPHKRVDWMTAKMLSTGGKISFQSDNNVGVVTQYDVDFGMPASHKTGTTGEIWSNAAGSTPLKDLKTNFFEPLADLGVGGGVIRMHPSKVFDLLNSNEVLAKFGLLSNGKTNGIDLSLQTVNNFLTQNSWPTIRPFNASVGIEVDGKVVYSNPFEKDNIVFTPDGQIGSLHVAPIVERDRPVDGVTYAEYNGNLVKKYSKTDPVVEFTAYEYNAFPSFDTIDQSFIMNTARKGSFAA
ncbi:hypothetical protein N180_02780 [Pedobacter antarcticus 4BY]|uniref:Phage major capsid protein E n=2 Tax=Pedobacter antarcticus TaxID=34086 RepID=A0A081PKG7_9SPHI|nr:major capsid protein [Pedobacter antarcticus]KEQ31190.1 hypothetical protein N180_02780 [Pedobacter antarcticus 4BY]SFE54447.1 Phage major capsid protein E [Pedobacter antarcticus]